MTARRLELGSRARVDLADIWSYSNETWGRAQAERYTDGLHDAMTALATGSNTGQRAQVKGFFKLRVGSHVIYYRQRPALIRVVRILHPKQHAEFHLSG